jgi:hypothetical protein
MGARGRDFESARKIAVRPGTRDSRQREAAVLFQKIVLQAWKEVDDTLTAYRELPARASRSIAASNCSASISVRTEKGAVRSMGGSAPSGIATKVPDFASLHPGTPAG